MCNRNNHSWNGWPKMTFPRKNFLLSHLSNSNVVSSVEMQTDHLWWFTPLLQYFLKSYWALFIFYFFCIYHSCPCHEAKLQTPPCNWYIIASLLRHFSSSAPLDPLPVSLDVESSGHNGLALEKHRGVCNYTRLWLPLVWSGLFNSHYMETLLGPLFNGPLAQFSFAPQPAAAIKLTKDWASTYRSSGPFSDRCWSIDRVVVHTAWLHTHIQLHHTAVLSFNSLYSRTLFVSWEEKRRRREQTSFIYLSEVL